MRRTHLRRLLAAILFLSGVVVANDMYVGEVGTIRIWSRQILDAGDANGIATLGADGKIPAAQINSIAIGDTFAVASQAAMLAAGATQGDIAIRSDVSQNYICAANPCTSVGEWTVLAVPVGSVFGRTGMITAGSGDYTAGQVTNVTAGSIAAVTVQAAVNELDGEKQALDATLTALAGLSGTGIVEATGADTYAFRALGTGASTSVLTRGDGDGRYYEVGTDDIFDILYTPTTTGDWPTDPINGGEGLDFLGDRMTALETSAVQPSGSPQEGYTLTYTGGNWTASAAASTVTWSSLQTLATGIDYQLAHPALTTGKARYLAVQRIVGSVRTLLHLSDVSDVGSNADTMVNTSATFSGSGGPLSNGYVTFAGATSYLRSTTTLASGYILGSRGTIEAWVRQSAFAANSNYISIGTAGARVVDVQITGTGYPRIAFYPGPTAHAVTSTATTLNAWNHVVWEWDGTNIRCYLNGSLVYTAAFTGSVSTATTKLTIGASENQTAEKFAGDVSEVRIIAGIARPVTGVQTAVYPTPPAYDYNAMPVSNLSASTGIGAQYIGQTETGGSYITNFRNLTGASGDFLFGVAAE